MKRLLFSFLVGLLTCALTISVARAINWRYLSALYAALLGISSTFGDAVRQPVGAVEMSLAAVVVSAVFVAAETLRARNSRLRWVGYFKWAVLLAASLLWFRPPAI